MRDGFAEHMDKLIVLAVLASFALSAVRGSNYSQHVVDWALGALGVLIVQKAGSSFRRPPDPPGAVV